MLNGIALEIHIYFDIYCNQFRNAQFLYQPLRADHERTETKMKTTIKTAALALFALTAANSAFADGHADVSEMTCAEFMALERVDQTQALNALTAEVDGVMADDDSIAEIGVLCNGRDDDVVAEVLDDDADS